MPVLGETIRLVELICARLCHDIGGLIGTVGNAVEMVAEDGGRDDEVLAFAASAATALSQRLRLLRTAWGPHAESMTLTELVDFERLNTGPMRVSLMAVDVETGEEVPFDTTRDRITIDHLLASSGLIPDFPAVEIGVQGQTLDARVGSALRVPRYTTPISWRRPKTVWSSSISMRRTSASSTSG